MKINKLEIENVKRVKAVKMEPSENGLTIIGGNNAEGKTSVLDAIAWALGGNTFRPSEPQREGSTLPPYIHITMSNGLVVERKGKNSDLKVTDPSGQKAGQQLLDSFVEKLALDLPRFMQASDKEKADTLLNIIGVGPQLAELEQQEKSVYGERTMVGRVADQKKKFAQEQPYYPEAPADIVSASELIQQQQAILLKNAENQKKRLQADELDSRVTYLEQQLSIVYGQAAEIEKKLEQLKEDYNQTCEAREIAFRTAEQLQDESTEVLERNIAQIDETNRMVRANLDKAKAEEDALIYVNQYNELTAQLDEIRQKKADLLTGAALPLPDLTIEDGRLLYKGHHWDSMSGAEQLKVATAIVRKLNPECAFVLIDKLEQMDRKTLEEFGEWLKTEGLQVIATRVSTGEECSIIIQDGYGEMKQERPNLEAQAGKTWQKGVF